LPHFFILSDKNYDTFLTSNYLKKNIGNWEAKELNVDNNNLYLSTFTYFQLLYIFDHYNQMPTHSSVFKGKTFFPNSQLKLNIYQYIDYSIYRLGHYDQNLELVRSILLPLSKYLD